MRLNELTQGAPIIWLAGQTEFNGEPPAQILSDLKTGRLDDPFAGQAQRRVIVVDQGKPKIIEITPLLSRLACRFPTIFSMLLQFRDQSAFASIKALERPLLAFEINVDRICSRHVIGSTNSTFPAILR